MKKIQLLAIVVCCANTLFAQTRKEKADLAYENMRALVATGDFMFKADSAKPISGSSINLATNSNHLTFSKESVVGYLPYFGEVTSGVAYTGEGAIMLDSKPLNYKVRFNDSKRMITITFSAKGKSGLYDGVLEVGGSAYAHLMMKSINRSSIRYYGRIGLLLPEKGKG